MKTNKHEQAACEVIEAMLLSATGRPAIGDISDVLLRVVYNSEFVALAKWAHDPLDTMDIEKLASALWCVIATKSYSDPIKIKSTISGISGESSQFDFVKAYAKELTLQTPIPEIATLDNLPAIEADVCTAFEEFLVGAVAWYSVCEVCNECFKFFLIVPTMREFCIALGDPPRMCKVSECLLNVIAIVEDRYR